ncbi:FecCD family ABC transporter permease [Pedobacter metabolipauper]|uniref:Iron complex transport system permease protein n=1 Tax=Pedobacter metabolipauper TaxID=425513 RepID=A0A4R6SSH2_9SPHI|nr:iron ABC transporter permease [Pedobacter metabolipauper]TDQ08247.1 iron complex transport system permease protein [Pedobacter metabolipauper]
MGVEGSFKKKIIYISLSAGLLLAILFSLGMGAMKIPVLDVLAIFLNKTGLAAHITVDPMYENVLQFVRLPRVLLGLLVGAALGISGSAIQGIFRNPLAEPGLIGISAGASFMAVSIIGLEFVLFAGLGKVLGFYLLAFGSFAGAGIAAMLVYQLSKTDGKPNVATMLLAGIAINALAGALTGLITYLADEQQLRTITFWMLGSLGGANWQVVNSLFPFVLIPVICLPFYSKGLNLFAIGEHQAEQIGLNPGRIKARVVFLATLAVGASVSVTGIIGFVGLLVPHTIRLMGGVDHKFVLPASALLGALVLTLSDMLARTVAAPIELPIGVITALLGTPVFLYILVKDKKKILY